jgi:uridine kinase
MTIVVGVSGPSCSGKSSLARGVAHALPECVILEQDWFFRSPSECPADANFCDLQYLDVAAFTAAALSLARGRAATVPAIDFHSFERTGSADLAARSFLIVEGMTIFRIPEVRDLCSHRFYLAPAFDVLAARKRTRDAVERGKPAAIIEGQLGWMRTEYNSDLSAAAANGVTLIESDDRRVAIAAILDALDIGDANLRSRP